MPATPPLRGSAQHSPDRAPRENQAIAPTLRYRAARKSQRAGQADAESCAHQGITDPCRTQLRQTATGPTSEQQHQGGDHHNPEQRRDRPPSCVPPRPDRSGTATAPPHSSLWLVVGDRGQQEIRIRRPRRKLEKPLAGEPAGARPIPITRSAPSP